MNAAGTEAVKVAVPPSMSSEVRAEDVVQEATPSNSQSNFMASPTAQATDPSERLSVVLVFVPSISAVKVMVVRFCSAISGFSS